MYAEFLKQFFVIIAGNKSEGVGEINDKVQCFTAATWKLEFQQSAI